MIIRIIYRYNEVTLNTIRLLIINIRIEILKKKVFLLNLTTELIKKLLPKLSFFQPHYIVQHVFLSVCFTFLGIRICGKKNRVNEFQFVKFLIPISKIFKRLHYLV